MKFGIELEGESYVGDVYDCLEYMKETNIVTSTNEKYFGIVNSMLSLPIQESIEARSQEGKTVKITRTK